MRFSSTTVNMEKNGYRFTLVNVQSKWLGKLWSCLGDSITQQNMWQPIVTDRLGLSYQNFGIGGTKVADTTGSDTTAMCRDERINSITITSDLITFMGGTNDWAQNVPLGTIDDVATNTFYGAVKTTFEKLITRFPTARIIAMSTPYGMSPNRSGWTDTTGYKNNLGLTTGDYAKVILEVARGYGIPCIDVYGEAGWNRININSFITNDGALLHPNTEGGKRLAALVVGKIKSFEPVY